MFGDSTLIKLSPDTPVCSLHDDKNSDHVIKTKKKLFIQSDNKIEMLTHSSVVQKIQPENKPECYFSRQNVKHEILSNFYCSKHTNTNLMKNKRTNELWASFMCSCCRAVVFFVLLFGNFMHCFELYVWNLIYGLWYNRTHKLFKCINIYLCEMPSF